MSLQDTNPKNPLNEGLGELKQQAISTAENQAAGFVSDKLNNPLVNKIVENKDTIKNIARNFSSSDEPIGTDAFSGRLNHPDDIKKYLSKKTFKDFLAEKDSPLVYCTLTIDGKEFLTKNSYMVELHQHTNDHDTFTISTPDDSLDSFEGYVMENSKKILGKRVTINYHRYGEVRQSFMGIIANIRNKKDEGGGYGKLFITGYAPSILLENGKDCQSYENKKLEDIIKEATAEYAPEAKPVAENLNTKYCIPYTVQYKESDYQFIKRLAHRYGEYFYYDGQSLIFGNKVQPIVEVGENIDLIDIEFEMMIKPQGFKYMSYDSISAKVKVKDSDSVQTQQKENPFQTIAVNASKEVFKKKAEMLFNATSHQNVESDLKEMVLRQKESRENTFTVRGRSRDPQLKIGGRAKISDINAKAMETYRIIEISHFHDGNKYHNEFVGIPDILISPFFDEDAFPTCEEQSATVTNNDHPQGMIKVQFPWQVKKGLKTPWLRVVTPYAGKGKGMHIIPENGEEVIVGFDNGNAERPFVFGAMFNGKASAGVGAGGNHIKRMQSASGSGMEFHDEHGHSRLWDAVNDEVKLDGAGNITECSNSSHEISVNKGQSKLYMDSDGKITLDGTTSLTITVAGMTITMDKTGIKLNGNNITIEGSSTSILKAPMTKITDGGSANATFNGTTVIKGSEVDIN